jgi:hypothetical protein
MIQRNMKSAAPRLRIDQPHRDRLQKLTMSTPEFRVKVENARRSDSLDNCSSEPIKHLMLAVLTEAVQCYQRSPGNLDAQSRTREFSDVKWWLFEDQSDGPFSFENVCYVLKFDPFAFRRALAESGLRQIRGRLRPPVAGSRMRPLRPTG